MTVPDVSLPFDVHTFPIASVILGKFNSQNSHILWLSIKSVFKYLLIFLRLLIFICPKFLRVKRYRNMLKSMLIRLSTINLKVFFCIFLNIKLELLDLLHINKMEMNRMRVRCQINDIEIINISHFICAVCTIHAHHHRSTVDKHSIHIIILIVNLKQC